MRQPVSTRFKKRVTTTKQTIKKSFLSSVFVLSQPKHKASSSSQSKREISSSSQSKREISSSSQSKHEISSSSRAKRGDPEYLNTLRRISFTALFAFSCSIFFSITALAMPVPTVESSVPVVSESGSALSAGLYDALVQILRRKTGNPDVGTLPAIRTAQYSIKQYVHSYYFEKRKNPAGDVETFLVVTFDATAVDTLLRDAGLPLWNAQRPTTLVWLSLPDNGTPRWLRNSDDAEDINWLVGAAGGVGLPVKLPSEDEVAQLKPGSASVSLDDYARTRLLIRASAAMGYTHVLRGKLMQKPNGVWDADWLYIADGVPQSWTDVADSERDILTHGMEKEAALMSAASVSLPKETIVRPVHIQVDGVANMDTYARVLKALQTISIVKSASLDEINRDGLLLTITTDNTPKDLNNAISASTHFAPLTAGADDNPHQAEYIYRWRGV